MAGPWDGFFDETGNSQNLAMRGWNARRQFAPMGGGRFISGTDSPPRPNMNDYETSYDGSQAFRPGVDDAIRPLANPAGRRVTNSDIAAAYQTRAANAQAQANANRLNQMSAQWNGGQGANRSTPQNVWDQAMPTMAQQMGDLTKDPAGLGRQMAGVGREIGSGLQAAADRMTEAGVGPLAPYSEKNPGPYNYMGPAMYGGESRDKLEKQAMGPFSQFFGGSQTQGGGPTPYYYPQGGGMSVQNGAFVPWDMDIERQKAMDVYRRQKWDQDAPMRNQMLQQYAPLWSQIFGGGGGGYRAPNYRLSFGNQQASGPQHMG